MTLHAGGIRRRLILTTRRFRAARDLLVAADGMRDRWAEADDAARGELWTNLHQRADDLRDSMA
ncbi:hypothetical protein ACIBJE_02130 [Micromonospora sp. NPDC050187]|uniref:hypothetical protein n=1 Tax=Micromonospora sp. NPDC050187 TaxID=3364277 RepID=UPI0037B5BAB5